jgi:hypothetical protein
MALTTVQRQWLRRQIARRFFGDGTPANITKADIDASVDPLVTYLETNQTAILNTMTGTPLASRTTAVKADVFALTAIARFGDVSKDIT